MLTAKLLGHQVFWRHFQNIGHENWPKDKTMIFPTPVCQIDNAFLLIYVLIMINFNGLPTNNFLFSKNIKIQDGCQSWSLTAATIVSHVTLLFILKQLVLTQKWRNKQVLTLTLIDIFTWQIRVLTTEIKKYMTSLCPLCRCQMWKMSKSPN